MRRHDFQPHRPGRARSARIRPVQLQSHLPRPPEAELPRLRNHRAGADAVAADRARTAGAGPDRARGGREIRDHLPLYRQSVIYAREGVDLDRATLADWVGQAEFLLSPLAEAIGKHVRAGSVLHADDTTVPVLAPGEGKTRTGRLWVVVRDERPWGSDVPPAAFYLYSPDRKGIRAEALLGTCLGFLHADGYSGFDRLYQPTEPGGEPALIEVSCWSHARRKIYDVHHATASPIALEALERIAALFAIESSIRGRPPEQREAARKEHALPLLEQLKTFLETSLR